MVVVPVVVVVMVLLVLLVVVVAVLVVLKISFAGKLYTQHDRQSKHRREGNAPPVEEQQAPAHERHAWAYMCACTGACMQAYMHWHMSTLACLPACMHV
eukprot:363403-Chlamydomonas_euryale.AAC.8